ncbi:hypothetical protein F2Q69_00053724 [Brassica cretica]|uniref:Uncharacterized protein n=1 Tax=Brassica cretica TaxID=69181 RepID=A0A8S9N1Q4_BRACR|nr:hypothetical protein F2Q69_00053724 [Brassica cretica]
MLPRKLQRHRATPLAERPKPTTNVPMYTNHRPTDPVSGKIIELPPISLDDALYRASYFATHEEEVAALKKQYSANKNNATKKPATPKEPTTKGQHSYAINDSPQKSSTYYLSKYCSFHDRKGHSTEECRAALCNQNENKKTTEEAGEEEEEPVTPKSN